jgi:Eukaryotic phosphomannomutase
MATIIFLDADADAVSSFLQQIVPAEEVVDDRTKKRMLLQEEEPGPVTILSSYDIHDSLSSEALTYVVKDLGWPCYYNNGLSKAIFFQNQNHQNRKPKTKPKTKTRSASSSWLRACFLRRRNVDNIGIQVSHCDAEQLRETVNEDDMSQLIEFIMRFLASVPCVKTSQFFKSTRALLRVSFTGFDASDEHRRAFECLDRTSKRRAQLCELVNTRFTHMKITCEKDARDCTAVCIRNVIYSKTSCMRLAVKDYFARNPIKISYCNIVFVTGPPVIDDDPKRNRIRLHQISSVDPNIITSFSQIRCTEPEEVVRMCFKKN